MSREIVVPKLYELCQIDIDKLELCECQDYSELDKRGVSWVDTLVTQTLLPSNINAKYSDRTSALTRIAMLLPPAVRIMLNLSITPEPKLFA
jgi:hypothetical protein